MKIQRNDQVLVVAGKDRGKTGRVLAAYPKDGRVMVEGVNLIKKHVRPSPNVRQAGIVQQPNPLDASNVMLICAKCGKPTRVGHEVLHVQEGDKVQRQKVRVCKKCRQQIE